MRALFTSVPAPSHVDPLLQLARAYPAELHAMPTMADAASRLGRLVATPA